MIASPGPAPLRRPPLRRAFSLIELLINLAIVASLVGIALPFYEDFVFQAQSAKARLDLDFMRNAISRYENFNGLMSGSSLGPLLGRYLQELPIDPWGNDYFLDANLGVVGSFGANGIQFGEDSEADIAIHYHPYLLPVKASYEGPFGVPGPTNRVVFQTNKVFGIVPAMQDQAANDIVLLRSLLEPAIPLGALGFRLSAATEPHRGRIVLECCVTPNPNTTGPTAPRLPVRADDLVNFSPLVLAFSEVPAYRGPLWENPEEFIFGTQPSYVEAGGLELERSR